MNEEKQTRVKELVKQISNYNGPFGEVLPTKKQVTELYKLTGIEWSSEDLQGYCYEYWSHHSLEETVYLLLHGDYPPVIETELGFWRYKPGVILNDQKVYETYTLGKRMNALETLQVDEMVAAIQADFPAWTEDEQLREDGWCFKFISNEQPGDWQNVHFWIFFYSSKMDTKELVTFSCHNVEETDIECIINCMKQFGCPLHYVEVCGEVQEIKQS